MATSSSSQTAGPTRARGKRGEERVGGGEMQWPEEERRAGPTGREERWLRPCCLPICAGRGLLAAPPLDLRWPGLADRAATLALLPAPHEERKLPLYHRQKVVLPKRHYTFRIRYYATLNGGVSPKCHFLSIFSFLSSLLTIFFQFSCHFRLSVFFMLFVF